MISQASLARKVVKLKLCNIYSWQGTLAIEIKLLAYIAHLKRVPKLITESAYFMRGNLLRASGYAPHQVKLLFQMLTTPCFIRVLQAAKFDGESQLEPAYKLAAHVELLGYGT